MQEAYTVLDSRNISYLDVGDGVLQFGSHNIVKGIDTSIGGLDGLIQRQESSLQAGKLHQQLH